MCMALIAGRCALSANIISGHIVHISINVHRITNKLDSAEREHGRSGGQHTFIVGTQRHALCDCGLVGTRKTLLSASGFVLVNAIVIFWL